MSECVVWVCVGTMDQDEGGVGALEPVVAKKVEAVSERASSESEPSQPALLGRLQRQHHTQASQTAHPLAYSPSQSQ